MSMFGEIVEPGTRTAWEDWDENIQDEQDTRLVWQNDVVVPTQIDRFIILEGRQIADSIKALEKFKLELVNAIHPVNIKLYRTKSSNSEIYVCILRDYNLLLASEIVNLIKMYIAISNDLIAVLTKPIVEYQATEIVMGQEYVIRSLTTTKPLQMSLAEKIAKLEQPNIISGVTAGVIALREINNQPAAAIIYYIEHNDEYQISELQELLKQLDLSPVQPQSNSILNSNLYI